SLLAGNIGSGGRTIFDGEERFTVEPIEKENKAGLGHLGNGFHLAAVVFDGDKIRINGQVVVPKIVAKRLEVPDAFAGERIEAERAIGEEIIAFAPAAVEFWRG